MPFSHFFVSKHRKVEFQISITIHELSKVPLVSGLYHVKWRIKNAHRSSGSTERAPIKDHCICWDYSLSTTAEIITNRENTLQPCDLKLEVFREEGDGRTESIGWLSLDLSEDAGAAISTQLYLLEESKFNSIFKLSINVSQKTQSPVKFNTPERRKKRFLADIPSMIIESKERSMVFDERSLKDASERSRKGAAPSIKKSYSSMSLPHYCRQNNPGEPSPSDLVEQLFMNPKVHTSP